MILGSFRCVVLQVKLYRRRGAEHSPDAYLLLQVRCPRFPRLSPGRLLKALSPHKKLLPAPLPSVKERRGLVEDRACCRFRGRLTSPQGILTSARGPTHSRRKCGNARRFLFFRLLKRVVRWVFRACSNSARASNFAVGPRAQALVVVGDSYKRGRGVERGKPRNTFCVLVVVFPRKVTNINSLRSSSSVSSWQMPAAYL
jgi:hypothetical protein